MRGGPALALSFHQRRREPRCSCPMARRSSNDNARITGAHFFEFSEFIPQWFIQFYFLFFPPPGPILILSALPHYDRVWYTMYNPNTMFWLTLLSPPTRLKTRHGPEVADPTTINRRRMEEGGMEVEREGFPGNIQLESWSLPRGSIISWGF